MHAIDAAAPLRGQIRALGIPEPLAFEQTILYRFFAGETLLYVGVTTRPFERWQVHKRSSDWWSEVTHLGIEYYPHERAALDAEVTAIRSEAPRFNTRSAHAELIDSSCRAHEQSVSGASATLPRVGVGGGGRGGACILYLTGAAPRPVDNSQEQPYPTMHAFIRRGVIS